VAVALLGLGRGLHDANAAARDIPEARVHASEHVADSKVDALRRLGEHIEVDEARGVQALGGHLAVVLSDVGGHDGAVEVVDLLHGVAMHIIRHINQLVKQIFVFSECLGVKL
jgi:hypothetical protein